MMLFPSKTRQILPIELLNEIFMHLDQINTSFLYNCLLVNRAWCLICIPLIWNKPFNKIKKYNKFNNIIEIYTELLDEDTKLRLLIFY